MKKITKKTEKVLALLLVVVTIIAGTFYFMNSKNEKIIIQKDELIESKEALVQEQREKVIQLEEELAKIQPLSKEEKVEILESYVGEEFGIFELTEFELVTDEGSTIDWMREDVNNFKLIFKIKDELVKEVAEKEEIILQDGVTIKEYYGDALIEYENVLPIREPSLHDAIAFNLPEVLSEKGIGEKGSSFYFQPLKKITSTKEDPLDVFHTINNLKIDGELDDFNIKQTVGIIELEFRGSFDEKVGYTSGYTHLTFRQQLKDIELIGEN